jgi:hypothetical protein
VQSYITFEAVGSGWMHFGLYIATLPTLTRALVGTTTNGVRLTSTGTLEYINTSVVQATTSALSTGRWYWIGVSGQNAAGVQLMQIDGSDAGGTGTAVSTLAAQLGFMGTEASAADVYIDDLIVDVSGFLAPSNVDIAFPISDNTRTAVTTGAGGTTNLWDAVNNAPPAGVATGSETATSNIIYPASATESYIANLETYTTLGVGASDTLIFTRGMIRHGEDINTGTKNGTYVGTTNPTLTDNTAFTFGNDLGAHGAEVGVWKTLWGSGKTTGLPTSGNFDTSPTIRVDRVSQSRLGCIDFMGMYVAWTPAAAVARVPYSTPYPQLLAH